MEELKKLGRYELRRVLGKGAMGVVYEGYDPTLSRRVAVKTILTSAAFDEETERSYAERFVREAKAVARFNHPNIVQVFDFGVENEAAYLVMEFIQGRELRDFFTAGERFEAGECIRIMGELLDALEFAHQAGVIHRDVKPANVMLDGQRRVKLADFGVARVQDSDRSAAGTMVGTPAFMSPEQISGGKVDRRTDIFSAGTLLYQMLTGEQPFKGEGAWTVAKQIMQDQPPAPSSVVRSVSPVFDAIVEKALAKNPAQRYASAREFATSVRGALDAGASALSSLPPKPKPKSEARVSEAEVEFWRSIQNSTDAAEIEFYLEQFPEGTYSQLARHKIAKLKEPVEAARKAAEEKARLEAEAKARQAAEERAKREAEEKARRETEEKVRQAQALARQKQQEEAARRAKAGADEDVTVALPVKRRALAPQAAMPPPEKTRSFAIPAVIAAVVMGGAIAAYLFIGRTPPAPAPVAAPAPTRPEAAPTPAVDVEKIRRETEERLRKEFAGKAAAERAALEKSLAEKIAAESAAAQKVAQAKGAAEKAAAEKAAAAAVAARVAAEKAAADKAASEKANTEKANAERAAAEKAAAERAAAEKQAADKAAAEKAALEKAAAEKAAADKLAAEKAAAANSVEAQLERFIQRKGRDKVLSAEPPQRYGSAPGMATGEVVYVNDGSCGPGRIKEVTGVTFSMGSSGFRPKRCISLTD